MKQPVDLGLLTADEFVARRSKTLIKNPTVQLDEETEVNTYLGSLDADYRKEIARLIPAETQPLGNSVREIITIIAYGEGSRIWQTLDCYLGQDINPEYFEIILFDNHPADIERDNTHEQVLDFCRENPHISLIYVHKSWGVDEIATVGNARKYVFDLALNRIHERNDHAKETILISQDADTIALAPNYLSAILTEFDNNPTVDALVTLNGVPFDTFVKPNLYATLSLWDALDNIVATNEPYNLIGSTSAYRSSIFAAIGGYNPNGKMAGDLETGFMIADARNWNPGSVIQLTATKRTQDPRRILEATASRIPVNEMYYKFVSSPEVRSADNAALLEKIPDSMDWELLEEDLGSFWYGGRSGMYKWRGRRFEHDYDVAMKRIGVDYTVVNEKVKLQSIDRLLKNYHRESGKEIKIIHSPDREADAQRMEDMGNFFSRVSDSAIECRRKIAEQLATEVQRLQDAHENVDENLLRQYERFKVEPYPD